nr:hypothetical protein [Leucobacter viscericola]
MGGTPIGAPLVGAAADVLGARSTLVISAVAAFLAFGIGITWLMVERQLRFHRDEGLRFTVTHVGRPGVDDDHAHQTETLTAPISVLRREEGLLVPGDSAPQDGAVADATTGAIRIDGIAAEIENDGPENEADGTSRRIGR